MTYALKWSIPSGEYVNSSTSPSQPHPPSGYPLGNSLLYWELLHRDSHSGWVPMGDPDLLLREGEHYQGRSTQTSHHYSALFSHPPLSPIQKGTPLHTHSPSGGSLHPQFLYFSTFLPSGHPFPLLSPSPNSSHYQYPVGLSTTPRSLHLPLGRMSSFSPKRALFGLKKGPLF